MKKKLFWGVAAILLALLFYTQHGSYEDKWKRRFKVLNEPSDEVLIGVCWPFSVNRDGMADGIHLALDEINSRRLAGRYTFRLIERDDEFDSKKQKSIAREFADRADMSAVLGYYDDGPAIRASSIYESSRLLHLMIGANNTDMTSHGFNYINRTILSSDRIALKLAKLTTDLGYRKIVVLWEEDAYGEDLAYQYQAGLDQLNAQVVYQWSFSRKHADFRLLVNDLKMVDADMIFFSALEPIAGDFLRMARKVGLKTPVLGAFSNTPEMREHAGPTAYEGAMMFDFYNPHSPSPENQLFVNKFVARYGRYPDAWAAQGYDALNLIARAVRFTGSRNPLDLSYAIRYGDAFNGANGRYKFDRAGNLEDKPIYLYRIQNGVPVLIE
ncbi:MAG: ABC transporter substrate-binding protein [Chlorobiaceae bacterium]|nr:ABC transporter substrate-binding protein [Chlorobiaceae bacterium]